MLLRLAMSAHPGRPCCPLLCPAGLSDLAPVEGVKSLTAYSELFAAELAPAAPALSE